MRVPGVTDETWLQPTANRYEAMSPERTSAKHIVVPQARTTFKGAVCTCGGYTDASGAGAGQLSVAGVTRDCQRRSR